jgi:Double-GTPase 2
VSTDVINNQCANQQCRVSQTGKCVEGLTLDKCPHIARTASGTDAAVSAETGTERATADISLTKAERLTVQGASTILRAGTTKVVAIIGPTSAGKTSLIASLCDLFQKGFVAELAFARCRTFFAFEQACHHARSASRRSSPQTEHTSLGSGVGFYHLGLRDNRTATFLNLLLSDRSGEAYGSVADEPSTASEFVEVHRADSITVLVNGDRLLDIGARHNVRQEAVMILQGLVNGDATHTNQRIALVLTKLDIIQGANAADRQRVERDFDGIVNQITQVFGSSFSEIRAFKIAAAPATTVLPHGHGVAELLRYWTDGAVRIRVEAVRLPKAARAMSRFVGVEAGNVS